MGGIHPDKYKITSRSPIIDAGIPEFVYIPLKQHIGKPALIMVKPGDKVKTGTLLADADSIISSDIHSSVTGEVVKIDTTENEFGYMETMITIKTEAVDEYEADIDTSADIVKDISFTSEEIAGRIRRAGLVGMGGAGFPTPVKTTVPENKKIEYFIINGIECEPFLTADDRLMVEKAEQIVIGAKIINKLLGIQNAVIAIDENKPQAIEILSKITKTYVGVNVQVLKTKYPQGGEKQLIKAVTGREVPSGKLPADVGCLVHNVGTVYAVYEAVAKNKTLIERIVTLSGDNCPNGGNYRVRIGTPASYLIAKTGLPPEKIGEIIFGGPMMGTSAANPQAPVTKLTSGILLLSDKFTRKLPETDCIRCGKCVEVCPMGLSPYLITKYAKEGMFAEAKAISALDCIECGSCAYICPAKIPLLDYCKLCKIELKK